MFLCEIELLCNLDVFMCIHKRDIITFYTNFHYFEIILFNSKRHNDHIHNMPYSLGHSGIEFMHTDYLVHFVLFRVISRLRRCLFLGGAWLYHFRSGHLRFPACAMVLVTTFSLVTSLSMSDKC